MPTGVYLDGNFANRFQHGDCRIEEKLLERTRLYHVPYRQTRANFDAFQPSYNDRGDAGKPWAGLPLVDFSPTNDLGGGVCEWVATYAKVPKARIENGGLFSFEYQSISPGPPPSIDSLSLSVPSQIYYTYFLTNNPASIACASVFRAVIIGGTVQGVGTPPTIGASSILGEDEVAPRWMGNIYQKQSRYIPARPLAPV